MFPNFSNWNSIRICLEICAYMFIYAGSLNPSAFFRSPIGSRRPYRQTQVRLVERVNKTAGWTTATTVEQMSVKVLRVFNWNLKLFLLILLNSNLERSLCAWDKWKKLSINLTAQYLWVFKPMWHESSLIAQFEALLHIVHKIDAYLIL